MYMVIAGKHPLFEPTDTKASYKRKLLAPAWVYGREFSKYSRASMHSLAKNLFVKLAATDPLVRYKASQALKHPWITRLHTEIPLNLFESLKRIKLYEAIDAVLTLRLCR